MFALPTVACAICLPLSSALLQASVRVVVGAPDESLRPSLETWSEEAGRRIERFFGKNYREAVILRVFASRAEFDKALSEKWKLPKTERWMVGAAGADAVYLLTPRVWKSEAAEHDPDDREGIAMLIAHELTHSYHSQVCPKPELEGMDEMAWFIEGLATYVSGQLESHHREAAISAIREGGAPKALRNAWIGKWRYGVSGSIVKYVDKRFGRKAIVRLLSATSNDEALRLLGVSEAELLGGWRAWVAH